MELGIKTMKKLRIMMLLVPMLFAVNLNAAVILSMSPSSTTAMPGDVVVLDLMISGLTAGAADSLGDFDLDIFYDSAALSVDSFSLTGLLGDVGLGEAEDFLTSGDDTFGTIALTLISLLPGFELDELQPGSFSLATISFMVDVLADGASTQVGISTVYALGDAFGGSLALMSTSSAVISNGIPVSEPSSLTMIFALSVMLFVRHKKILN
jgi:hypothetical protein